MARRKVQNFCIHSVKTPAAPRSCARPPNAERGATLALACSGPAPLAAGGLLLCRGASLGRVATARVRFLTSVLGSVGRVGDPRCALLRHSLVLQRLVLLLVLDIRRLAGHSTPPS